MANEKRLIDAVRLREALERYANAPHITIDHGISKCMRMAIDTCIELLDMQRAIDAVEVVRCKDCKACPSFDDNGIGYCWEHGNYILEDDFCSYGERREGE